VPVSPPVLSCSASIKLLYRYLQSRAQYIPLIENERLEALHLLIPPSFYEHIKAHACVSISLELLLPLDLTQTKHEREQRQERNKSMNDDGNEMQDLGKLTKIGQMQYKDTYSARISVPMLTLAKTGQFETILRILQESDLFILGKWLDQGGPDTTALHELVRYRPTVEVVDRMARTLTMLKMKRQSIDVTSSFSSSSSSSSVEPHSIIYAEEARDGQGRTPLHVAVAVGCDVNVVKRLAAPPDAKMISQAAGIVRQNLAAIQDRHGRCPLHWACTNPSGAFTTPDLLAPAVPRSWRMRNPVRTMQRLMQRLGGTHSARSPDHKMLLQMWQQEENMHDIVHYLVRCYPQAVTLRDAKGFTPMELAEQAKASEVILCLVQGALGFLHQVQEQQQQINTTATGKCATDHTDFGPIMMCLEFSSRQNSGWNVNDEEDDDVSSLGSTDAFRAMTPPSPRSQTAPKCRWSAM